MLLLHVWVLLFISFGGREEHRTEKFCKKKKKCPIMEKVK